MTLLTEGVRPLLVGSLGFDEARAERTEHGLFVVTQQLDFGDVPAPGTPVSAQASLLTASTSTLLIRTDLFEPEGHRVCNLVTRYVHVDLRTRRSIPLPANAVAGCTTR
ncbi:MULTISPECIES: thioesterase family protein [Rhodococcus]|uniref:thioesterase family protein n=1 Tax=Rhodococcus TaxID=1827 RepID=UPI0008305FD7|nr:thioesterase family protein [Rhodococcus phenolicus]